MTEIATRLTRADVLAEVGCVDPGGGRLLHRR